MLWLKSSESIHLFPLRIQSICSIKFISTWHMISIWTRSLPINNIICIISPKIIICSSSIIPCISCILKDKCTTCIFWWYILFPRRFRHFCRRCIRPTTCTITITSRESIIISPLIYIPKRTKILIIIIFIINCCSSEIPVHHHKIKLCTSCIYNISIYFSKNIIISPMCIKCNIIIYNIITKIPLGPSISFRKPSLKSISWQFWIYRWNINY